MSVLAYNDEAEWLAIRETHIGGSEVASLFYQWRMPDGSERVTHLFEPIPDGAFPLGCCSPHKTGYRLYMEKAGLLRPDDLSENERINAGKYLEPGLAAWSKQKWEWPLNKATVYHRHKVISGWGASLDYFMAHKGEVVPVEFKNVDYLIFRDDWTTEGKGDDEQIIMPPLHVILQLQHQMGAVDAQEGWIVACVSGNRLLRGCFALHAGTQVRIAEAIAKFWWAQGSNTMPLAEYADYDTVSRQYAVGDHNAVPQVQDEQAFARHASRYLRWHAHLEKVQNMVDSLKARLCAQIGAASRFRAGGFRGSWAVVNIPAKMRPAKWQPEKNYRGAFKISLEKK